MKKLTVKNQRTQAMLDKISGKVEFIIVVAVIIGVILAIRWYQSL